MSFDFMRREHNDFCAEISRRKDHIVKKRNQRRRMLLCCIPFVVCVFVFAAVGTTNLFSRGDIITPEGETGAVSTHAPESVKGPYITVSIPGKTEDDIVIDDESDVFAVLSFIESNSNMFMRSDGDGWYLYSAVINTEKSSELVVEIISTACEMEQTMEENEESLLPEAPESVLETELETEWADELETDLDSEEKADSETAEATKKAEESTKRAETFATGAITVPETELVDETYTEGGDELETEKIEEAETEKSEEETPCDTYVESYVYYLEASEESVDLYFEQESIVITLTDAEGRVVKYALPIWLNEAFGNELMAFLESLGN